MAKNLGDSNVLVFANTMVDNFYFVIFVCKYPYAVAPSFSILVAIGIFATNGGDGGALRLMGHSHPIFPPIKGFFIQNQCFDIGNLFYFTLRDAILEWGKIFMQFHPSFNFEKLEMAFCK
jgi:hypothetical protein